MPASSVRARCPQSLAFLGRGYAVLERLDTAIRSAASVRPGDRVRVTLSEGELPCRVEQES